MSTSKRLQPSPSHLWLTLGVHGMAILAKQTCFLLCRQWRCITTAARKPQQLAEPVAREEGWEMSARASPTQGDALEEQLTSQVEQDAEAGLAGEVQEQLPSTCKPLHPQHPTPAAALPQIACLSSTCFRGGQIQPAGRRTCIPDRYFIGP